jgi:hypothetical protein
MAMPRLLFFLTRKLCIDFEASQAAEKENVPAPFAFTDAGAALR